MLTRMLTAVVLAPIPQVPAPPCTLAGPPVEARWSGAIPPASTAEAPLRVVAHVPLPGSASRFDYQSLEPASGRLFISHMGAGRLVVFDVRAGRVIADLDGFPTVTGVLAVPVEHRAYAAATGDHAVVVVDDSTFRIVARVPGPRSCGASRLIRRSATRTVSTSTHRTVWRSSPVRRAGRWACWTYEPSSCVRCSQSGAIPTSWRSIHLLGGCTSPPSPASWRCS